MPSRTKVTEPRPRTTQNANTATLGRFWPAPLWRRASGLPVRTHPASGSLSPRGKDAASLAGWKPAPTSSGGACDTPGSVLQDPPPTPDTRPVRPWSRPHHADRLAHIKPVFGDINQLPFRLVNGHMNVMKTETIQMDKAGRVVIPKPLRELFNLVAGDRLPA